MCNFLRKLTTLSQPLFMAAALAVAIGGLGGPVMSAAETRASSSEENIPVDERQEESTATFRVDHHRQVKLDERRLAIVFEVPTSARLGHTQNTVLFAPSGHRLSNGLLAPLTC
jgi:hypothetical protein